MPGLNYANWSATLIPFAGIVFGVIGPAKYAGRRPIIAQKETQQKSRAGARIILKQRRGHCQLDSEVTVTVGFGECQEEFGPCRKSNGRELRKRASSRGRYRYHTPGQYVREYITPLGTKKAIDERNI